MRKIVSITYVTLDGVMQSPGAPEEDPRGGFTEGGWMVSYWDELMGKVIDQNMKNDFDLLLGRRTYEMFAAHWPHAGDNPVTQRFNKATKYVVSRSLKQFDWINSDRISGDVVAEVKRLRSTAGPEIQVHGSSELMQTLIAAQLIDEYRIWIYPLVLGEGKRLFENGVSSYGLTLVDSKTSSTGVLINTYQPNGAVKTGSFQLQKPNDAELARRRKILDEDTGN